MELVIDDIDDLRLLHERGRRSTLRRVRLAGRLADTDTERRLNSAYFDCGCQVGSVAVSLTLLTCVVGGVLTGLTGLFGVWNILGYLAAAALAGKALGLAIARIRLGRIERTLRARGMYD